MYKEISQKYVEVFENINMNIVKIKICKLDHIIELVGTMNSYENQNMENKISTFY